MAMQLPREALEHRRELRRVRVAAAVGRDGDAGRLAAGVGEADGAEVDVLDRPAVADHRGDRHAERGRIALPRPDDRRDVGLRAREVLDRARDRAWRAGSAELERLHPAAFAASNPDPVDAKLAQWSDQ